MTVIRLAGRNLANEPTGFVLPFSFSLAKLYCDRFTGFDTSSNCNFLGSKLIAASHRNYTVITIVTSLSRLNVVSRESRGFAHTPFRENHWFIYFFPFWDVSSQGRLCNSLNLSHYQNGEPRKTRNLKGTGIYTV